MHWRQESDVHAMKGRTMEWFLLLTGLICFSISIYLFWNTILSGKRDEEALAWASGAEPNKSKSGFINLSRPLVHNLTLQHTSKLKSETYRKSVKKKISTAGLSKELNVDEFIGLQILWGIMFPIFVVLLNFSLQLGYSYILCLSIGLLGFYFPHLHCSQCRKKRYSSIILDLPFFIDLLALSTEAGLDFINSIQRIVDKAQDSVLADEFAILLKDIKLGRARAEALKDLAERLDIPEVTSLCAVIIDADYTGASIAEVLKDQSIQMRLERFVRAEKAGALASQAILFPMMFFTLPAVFIALIGPAILQFLSGGLL